MEEIINLVSGSWLKVLTSSGIILGLFILYKLIGAIKLSIARSRTRNIAVSNRKKIIKDNKKATIELQTDSKKINDFLLANNLKES